MKYVCIVVLLTMQACATDWWDGDYYEKHASLQHKESMALISRLQLKEHEFLLDVGCGD